MKLTVKQVNLIIYALEGELEDNSDNEKDIEELIETLQSLPVDLNNNDVTSFTGFNPKGVVLTGSCTEGQGAKN